MQERKKANRSGVARAVLSVFLVIMMLTGVLPADLPLMNRTAQAAAGYVIKGDSLHGTTLRIRPANNRTGDNVGTALGIRDNGHGGPLVYNDVILYPLSDSSRFLLEKAGDECFTIYYHNGSAHSKLNSKIVDVEGADDHKKEGGVVQVVQTKDTGKAYRQWRFIRRPNGSFWIQNVHSGKYWKLEGGKTSENTRVVQSSTATDWEIEIVTDRNESAITRMKRQYDSYTYYMNGAFGTGTDTDTITSADWMTHLPDNICLSDLTIPGTHDASAADVEGGDGNANGQTQLLTIHDQLYAGVRYFDLRFSGEGLLMVHGPVCNCRFEGKYLYWATVRNWIDDFLDRNPGETVILQIKADRHGESTERAIMKNLRSWNKVYHWNSSDPKIPTLGEVRGKVVVISRCEKYTDVSDIALNTQKNSGDGWKEGNTINYSHELATYGTSYEVWTQDKYKMGGAEKNKWINGSLFNTSTNALHRRNATASKGKKALVITYTSCTNNTPQAAARWTVHPYLKKELYSWKEGSSADAFLGVVCCDFCDEELAWLIYRRNFFNYRVIIRGMSFDGETPFPDYVVSFNGKQSGLQQKLENEFLSISQNFSGTINGKQWLLFKTNMYLTTPPDQILTNNDLWAAKVTDYNSLQFEDGQLLLYAPLDYLYRTVTITYNNSNVTTTSFPSPQTLSYNSIVGGAKFTRPADPVADSNQFKDWLFYYGAYPAYSGTTWAPFDFSQAYLQNVTVYADWDSSGGYLVTVDSSSGGSISVAGNKSVFQAGETVTLIPSPDEGYSLKNLTVTTSAGTPVSVNNNQFTMPKANVRVYGEFDQDIYRIKTEVSLKTASGRAFLLKAATSGSSRAVGSIDVEGNKTEAFYGEDIHLSARPAEGFKFVSIKAVTDAGNDVDLRQWIGMGEKDYALTMPADNITVSAQFTGGGTMLFVNFGTGHEDYVRRIFGNNPDVYFVSGPVVGMMFEEPLSPDSAYYRFLVSVRDVLGITSLPADGDCVPVNTLGTNGDFALHPKSYYNSISDLMDERLSSEWRSPVEDGVVILYALWSEPVSESVLSADSPVCGTSQAGENPQVEITGSMHVHNYHWAGSGTEKMVGDHEYAAAVQLIEDWGYYVPDGKKLPDLLTVSGDNVRITGRDYSSNTVTVAIRVEHEWGPWRITREPRNGVDGEKQRVCVGGCVETAAIPAAHVHSLSYVAEKEPGCEETGTREHWICDQGTDPCYGIYADKDATRPISDAELIIPATGHDWGEWSVSVPATCVEEGILVRFCRNSSDHVESKSIDIDPDAHDWSEWTLVREATASAAGLERRVCSLCSRTEERSVPYGHVHGFTYTAGEDELYNTVTAVCSAPGCSDCPYYSNGITITLNGPADDSYDGKPKEAFISGYPSAPVENLAPRPEITYYRVTRNGEETPVVTLLSGAPVNPGSYLAKITWGGATAEILFEVYSDGIMYFCVSGEGQNYVKKSGKDAVFIIERSEDDYLTWSKFQAIRVDGKTVSSKNYDCRQGSVIISLKSKWLDTLSVGKHTMTALFSDGSVDVPFTISKPVPQTGDHASPLLWAGLVLLGILGICGLVVFRKKKV